MALAAEVTARYPSARLIQLTRPGTQTATTVDATLLGKACTDVEADFEIIAGIAYDNSDARHVSVAVWGVVSKLAQWSEAAGSTAIALADAWVERLEQLAKVTGRNRMVPKTKSVYTHTSEQQDAETVVPWDDWTNYDDLIPKDPG